LLEEGDRRDALELPRLQAEPESDQHAELPREQRDDEREADAVASRERVPQAEAGEAREESEVLVEGEELEHRPLPTDHSELEEQTQARRARDGEIQIGKRQRVEERGLIPRIGIERRREAPQQ